MSKPTSRFMIRSFEKQFPSLFEAPSSADDTDDFRPLVRASQVEVMQVRQMTLELLTVIPRFEGATGNLVDIRNDEHIFLLRADMSIIGEVRQEEYYHHNEVHREPTSRRGETIGEAILRMDCARSLGFILLRHTGFEIENSHSVGGYDVTLYKLPVGWSVPEWVEEQLRLAKQRMISDLASPLS